MGCRGPISSLVLAALLLSRGVEGDEIHKAAMAGDLPKIKALVGGNPKLLNLRDDQNGFTPLICAAYTNQVAVLEFLLKSKADIRVASNEGLRPIHFAARGGSRGAIEVLLGAGADANDKSAKGAQPPLQFAASQFGAKHREVVEFLLARGANVNARNFAGGTALLATAFTGDAETAKLLLANHADVNRKDENGTSPLHLATFLGYEAVVRVLLDYNAAVQLKTQAGESALHLAALPSASRQSREKAVIAAIASIGGDAKGFLAAVDNRGRKYAAIARMLLDSKADANAKDGDGWPVLHYAARDGNSEIVDILLAHGANIEARDRDHFTALHTAAEAGRADVVRVLLDHGADVSARVPDGRTALHHAAAQNMIGDYTRIVAMLIAHNAEVDAREVHGGTALMLAARLGALSMAKLLLANKADPNAALAKGRTPLHEVTREWRFRADKQRMSEEEARRQGNDADYLALAELLLSKGARLDVSDSDGWTPFHGAVSWGDKRMVELFLKKGANVHAKTKIGTTPLHVLIYGSGNIEVARLLLAHQSELEVAEAAGVTPLLAAVSTKGKRNPAIVELLLREGANIRARGSGGETALHWTAIQGDPVIAEILVKYQADIDATDSEGITPLMQAAQFGQRSVAELLLSHGANVNKTVLKGLRLGDTALKIATRARQGAVANLLRERGALE